MTGPEHYTEAQRLLEETGQEVEVEVDAIPTFLAQMRAMTARAQVHATLALTAATALGAGDYEAWAQAIRGEVTP